MSASGKKAITQKVHTISLLVFLFHPKPKLGNQKMPKLFLFEKMENA